MGDVIIDCLNNGLEICIKPSDLIEKMMVVTIKDRYKNMSLTSSFSHEFLEHFDVTELIRLTLNNYKKQTNEKIRRTSQ